MSCTPVHSSFLCLHGFRSLLLRNGLGLTGADAHKTLQLFHKDKHQNSVRTVQQAKISLWYSNSQNVTYASLSHAGDHPLMRKLIPSFLYDSAKILLTLGFTPFTVGALWTRLLSTSAGAHAVVATVPARSEARKWVKMPSLSPRLGFERR
jgi:hypothetical protein